jgi:hypothetical protein
LSVDNEITAICASTPRASASASLERRASSSCSSCAVRSADRGLPRRGGLPLRWWLPRGPCRDRSRSLNKWGTGRRRWYGGCA